MVPADEKPGRADGQEMQEMPTVQHQPGAAPAPQARKTVYNRETGEAHSGLYAVDAREYVRTGRFTYTPPNPNRKEVIDAAEQERIAGKPNEKISEGEGKEPAKTEDPVPEKTEAKEPVTEDFVATDEGTRPITWEDWSTPQLRAVGKEVSVVNVEDLGRPEVIKALEDAGVEPKDERPEIK